MILNRHRTRVMKAADLIDVIIGKEAQGFNMLMDYLNYEYPSLYMKLMGKSSGSSSASDKAITKKSRHFLLPSLSGYKETMNVEDQPQKFLEGSQKTFEDLNSELGVKRQQILELSENILELQTQNEELAEQAEEAQKEILKAEKKEELFRQERDKYYSNYLVELEKQMKDLLGQKRMSFSNTEEQLSHPTLSEKMSTLLKNMSHLCSEGEEIKKLTDAINRLENENKEVVTLKCQSDLFERSLMEYKDQLRTLKRERDEVLNDLTDIKEKYRKLQGENNSLKASLHCHQSQMRMLINENTMLKQSVKQHHDTALENVEKPGLYSTPKKIQDKSRATAEFQYTIQNISKLEGETLSPPCYIRNLLWRIMAVPRQKHEKCFGFFLQCNTDSVSCSWSCNATAQLKILPQKPEVKPFIRKINNNFCSKENDWGFSNFISWKDLLDKDKGFVKDDTVILEVQVEADLPTGISEDFDNL